MCGRFAADLDYEQLCRTFAAAPGPQLPRPSWNIAPGQPIALIAQDGQGRRHLNAALWNLLPPWAASPKLDYPTHNARIESALDKRTYAEAARSHRALIPASGYYEWTRTHEPYYFRPPGDEPLLIGGLYSWWRPDDRSPWLLTATILTTQAQGRAAEVHDRMPVLIDQALVDDWLDTAVDGAKILPTAARQGLALSTRLHSWQVGPLKGDGPQLTEGITLRL
ncbi:SOS response-associated peptidase [Bifidobacterium xylocopae]|uniref:Abasic site processing protein n=1 Tax=Bifidobacterium xylocopae TaxID=2493119 RepID=A0A366KEQ7_9BIFI|nr:SOS response-associated peptidase [Bifidobacterium xylocopae]RBP99877.1 DUF159 family protein [Bifidobacterium xylocopae]